MMLELPPHHVITVIIAIGLIVLTAINEQAFYIVQGFMYAGIALVRTMPAN